MSHYLAESIPAPDWNATPATVQNVILSLERERNALREQLERLEQGRETEAVKHQERLLRYHTLVEQQFRSGLTLEQQDEIARLGQEIDASNATFYPSLASLSETIATGTGQHAE